MNQLNNILKSNNIFILKDFDVSCIYKNSDCDYYVVKDISDFKNKKYKATSDFSLFIDLNNFIEITEVDSKIVDETITRLFMDYIKKKTNTRNLF